MWNFIFLFGKVFFTLALPNLKLNWKDYAQHKGMANKLAENLVEKGAFVILKF